MSTTRSPAPREPAISSGDALLVCAHGVDGGPGIATAYAEALRAVGRYDAVIACCLHGRPGLEAAIAETAATRLRIMPLLMAEGVSYRKLTQRAQVSARRDRKVIDVQPVLGADPALGRLIETKAEAVAKRNDWLTAETGLLLVGHGTRRDPDSAETLRRQTEAIAARSTFAEVRFALIENDPGIRAVMADMTITRLVAVGFFLDQGTHGMRDVPEQLAAFRGTAIYAGPIGADPALPGILLDRAGPPPRAVA